ncbi:MAG: hypothetical protein AB1742_15830 [bacterium]
MAKRGTEDTDGRGGGVKVVLVGAAGMSFGPVMAHDAIHTPGIRGGRVVLMDVAEKRLDEAFAAAARLNRAAGEPVRIEKTTDSKSALDGADFVILSVESDRFKCWKQDYEAPLKHGSTQIMGENGGPGGLFHSLRSIRLCLSIAGEMEKLCPDAYLINLTNPLSRVTLAISRATRLKHAGLCHEFTGGLLRTAAHLLIPPGKISAEAAGINHFSFFHRIERRDTGEDLYPLLRRHARTFPFLYQPLVRHMFKKYGLLPVSSDSHIGEYVGFAKEVVGRHPKYYKLFDLEWRARDVLVKAYGRGLIPLPVHRLPRSHEQAFPLIEGLATEKRVRLDGVNVPNRGYVPNLPDGAIVEVPAFTGRDDLEPETVPPVHEPLAELMRLQIRIQDLVVDAALSGDPAPAFEALRLDPLSPPDETSCRKLFDEMVRLQAEYLPF